MVWVPLLWNQEHLIYLQLSTIMSLTEVLGFSACAYRVVTKEDGHAQVMVHDAVGKGVQVRQC